MGRRARSRQVEIFNFSFLDILACTIGLLIFIMVMVFILQSSSPVADTGAIIERKLSEASTLQTTAATDAQIAGSLEAAANQVRVPDNPDLTQQRESAQAARNAANERYEHAVTEAADAEARLDEARLLGDRSVAESLARVKAELLVAHQRNNQANKSLAEATRSAAVQPVALLPYTRPGQPAQSFQVLHVDCHAEQLVLLKENHGKVVEVGRSALKELGNSQSAFHRAITAHGQLDHPLVLFWIRPDGADAYAAAVAELPEAMPHGFEPADAGWSFDASAQ